MSFPIRYKDPNGVSEFPVTTALHAQHIGTTISSVVWTIPAGLTKVSQRHTDYIAYVRLSGGSTTEGTQYTCKAHVVFADGQEEDQTFIIEMRED